MNDCKAVGTIKEWTSVKTIVLMLKDDERNAGEEVFDEESWTKRSNISGSRRRLSIMIKVSVG